DGHRPRPSTRRGAPANDTHARNLGAGTSEGNLFAVAAAVAEADVAARPAAQFAAVDVELLQRPLPVPLARVHVAHHQQVLQLLDLRKAEALRRGDGGAHVQAAEDVLVPALDQLPPQPL